MSIWYQYKVHVLAVDKAATARFFNLDPKEDVNAYADSFEFSFGGKNMPSMRLGKIVEQNPDCIFLVTESVEDSHAIWIERNDKAAGKYEKILLEDSGMFVNEINKRALDEYTNQFPTLTPKHLAHEKGFEEFRWSMFLGDFGKTSAMLRRDQDYKEMVSPFARDDGPEEDFSHLEIE